MSSDDSMRQGSPGYRQPGIGAWATFRCGKCDQKTANGAGNGMRKVRGLKTRVCKPCKEAIDARAAA